MNSKIPADRGIIKWIILLIIALLILSYYGFSLRDLVSSPTTQDNFGYAASTTVTFWDTYLKQPADYLWNTIFISLIWNPAIHNLENLRDGTSTDIQQNAPQLPPVTPIPN